MTQPEESVSFRTQVRRIPTLLEHSLQLWPLIPVTVLLDYLHRYLVLAVGPRLHDSREPSLDCFVRQRFGRRLFRDELWLGSCRLQRGDFGIRGLLLGNGIRVLCFGIQGLLLGNGHWVVWLGEFGVQLRTFMSRGLLLAGLGLGDFRLGGILLQGCRFCGISLLQL